jgi:hypothetical protein
MTPPPAPPPRDDDEQLLAELHAALQARREVPDDLVQAGKSLFDWRHVDAELAELTYDSALGATAVARAADPPRAMSLRGLQLSIELELAADALRGQVFPGAGATVETEDHSGDWASVRCDAQGWFVIAPPPVGAFRLTVRAGGAVVRTGWM